MGTHPIFESDFDCLTEWPKTELPFSRTTMSWSNVSKICARNGTTSHERSKWTSKKNTNQRRIRANYCRNRGRLFEDFGDISHFAEQCQNANDQRSKQGQTKLLKPDF